MSRTSVTLSRSSARPKCRWTRRVVLWLISWCVLMATRGVVTRRGLLTLGSLRLRLLIWWYTVATVRRTRSRRIRLVRVTRVKLLRVISLHTCRRLDGRSVLCLGSLILLLVTVLLLVVVMLMNIVLRVVFRRSNRSGLSLEGS